jgi:hypothetical protein
MGQTQEDGQHGIVDAMIKCCYLPGTNERFFEKGDYPELAKSSSGGDFGRIAPIIAKALGVTDEELENRAKN